MRAFNEVAHVKYVKHLHKLKDLFIGEARQLYHSCHYFERGSAPNLPRKVCTDHKT